MCAEFLVRPLRSADAPERSGLSQGPCYGAALDAGIGLCSSSWPAGKPGKRLTMRSPPPPSTGRRRASFRSIRPKAWPSVVPPSGPSTSKPAPSAATRRRRPDELKSLSFAEYLVAKKSFNHDAIGTLAKLIFTSRQALAAAIPGENQDPGARDRQGRQSRRAPGRARLSDRRSEIVLRQIRRRHLLRSVDLSNLRIGDRRRRQLFPRYGRTRRLRLLQHLLDLVQKVNQAPSLETLDKLQVDADHVVVAIIHQTRRKNTTRPRRPRSGSRSIRCGLRSLAVARSCSSTAAPRRSRARRPRLTSATESTWRNSQGSGKLAPAKLRRRN